MKLGETLSKIKKEKSRLARLISLRKDNVWAQKGKKAKFNPTALTKDIDKKIDEIRMLKLRIQNTNLQTNVEGESCTLAEAIIKVNDIRSKIAQLSSLFEEKREFYFREKDKVEKVAQIDERDVEDLIEQLEIEKVQLDNKIQITNWKTDLKD